MSQQVEMSTLAPAMAPATPQARQQEELQFLKDRRYAFHGEIMMIALFAVFSVFICFVTVFPCVRRLRKQAGNGEDSSNDATEVSPRSNNDDTATKFPSQL